MLIDVSRKPIRLIPEECASVVVVRTMAIRGGASGIIHQHIKTKYTSKDSSLAPTVTVPNGDVEHIETLLPAPNILVPKVKAQHGLHSRPEHHTVSGYQDLTTKRTGTWRVNFIFDGTQKDDYLLTLFDETNSVMLFTVQIQPSDNQLWRVTTPLRRFLNRQMNDGLEGADGLWGAVLDDDF